MYVNVGQLLVHNHLSGENQSSRTNVPWIEIRNIANYICTYGLLYSWCDLVDKCCDILFVNFIVSTSDQERRQLVIHWLVSTRVQESFCFNAFWSFQWNTLVEEYTRKILAVDSCNVIN